MKGLGIASAVLICCSVAGALIYKWFKPMMIIKKEKYGDLEIGDARADNDILSTKDVCSPTSGHHSRVQSNFNTQQST